MSKKESRSIISAVCWVKKGYAAPVMKEYEPTEQEMRDHLKESKRLLKGGNIKDKEITEAT